MAKRPEHADPGEKIAELLKKLLIAQLALAGVGQAQIREVVGCSIGEVNGVAKLIRPTKRGFGAGGAAKTAN
ncbi:MAG: hypothetical protein ABSF16_16095 [Terracidiphilus sp.]|jgi:hypothetical protein